jgi:hypothetical protein
VTRPSGSREAKAATQDAELIELGRQYDEVQSRIDQLMTKQEAAEEYRDSLTPDFPEAVLVAEQDPSLGLLTGHSWHWKGVAGARGELSAGGDRMSEETPHLFPYLNKPKHVEKGDIVQIAEGHEWEYALAIVDEVRELGHSGLCADATRPGRTGG